MDKIKVMLIDIDEKYLIPIELKLIEMLGDKIELSVITDLDILINILLYQGKSISWS